MAIRGAFHPRPTDAVPKFSDHADVGTLILLGWTGGHQWPAFAASQEAVDERPHPLDRWSRRLIDAAAVALDAIAFYPFGGPPHYNFQHWALRAEPVARSPVGLLIRPEWGLWHAYRGALGFRQRLMLTGVEDKPSPCAACVERPCLSSCPVAAFSNDGSYQVEQCVGHLNAPMGQPCMTLSCAARRSCPVQRQEAYPAPQSAFHMQAFLRGHAS
jgi:hypothetical protein